MRYLNMARHWFWIAPIVLGIGFIGGGIYMATEGYEAKDEVKDAIVREKITTSDDASMPNEPVDDAATAKAQAEAIERHSLEATGGRSYAELDPDDPLRDTALTAANLRTSLNLAVMGFKVSDLVIGMGFFLVAVGGTFVIFLAPAVYWAAEVANERAQDQAQTARIERATPAA